MCQLLKILNYKRVKNRKVIHNATSQKSEQFGFTCLFSVLFLGKYCILFFLIKKNLGHTDHRILKIDHLLCNIHAHVYVTNI